MQNEAACAVIPWKAGIYHYKKYMDSRICGYDKTFKETSC
jgi:hypothetical protein